MGIELLGFRPQLNRPVRTRMPWWCGEGARKRASLPDFCSNPGYSATEKWIKEVGSTAPALRTRNTVNSNGRTPLNFIT
jgi:hypothetical protein